MTLSRATTWLALLVGLTVVEPGASVASYRVSRGSDSFPAGHGAPGLSTGTDGAHSPLFVAAIHSDSVDFAVHPESLALGSIPVGSSIKSLVTVVNSGLIPLFILSVHSDSVSFTVSPTGATIDPSDSAQFSIVFSPMSVGIKTGHIIFEHDAGTSPDTVDVSGVGVPSGSFSPGSRNLVFGSIPVNGGKRLSVRIDNVSATPLLIFHVSSEDPQFTGVTYSTVINPGDSTRLYVWFFPSDSGVQSGNMVILHSGATSPDTIWLTGTGTITPIFSVAPQSLYFGLVKLGDSKSDSLQVRNLGRASLNISSAGSDDAGEYALNPSSASIPPGGELIVRVQFAPSALGLRPAQLTFLHDGDSSPDEVGLTGVGRDTTPTKFLTVTPETLVAKYPGTRTLLRPNARGIRKFPNWANLISEVVLQGGFRAAASESDSLGGLVVGISHLVKSRGHWAINKDSARVRGWVRLTQWSGYRGGGRWQDLQRTLEDKSGLHTGTQRGFDSFVKELHLLPPRLQSNRLFAELVALKFNIAASQLGKTPPGFGDLIFQTGGNPCDGLSIMQISAKADTALTYWQERAQAEYDSLYFTIFRLNRAFRGVIDTFSFNVGRKLVLGGAVDVKDIPFLSLPPGPLWRTVLSPLLISGTQPDISMDPLADSPSLSANYPNPFNPSTSIEFELPDRSVVTLKVYNSLGQEVVTLLNQETMEDGFQNVTFDAGNLASGIYFYRLTAQAVDNDDLPVSGKTFIIVKKMVLLK